MPDAVPAQPRPPAEPTPARVDLSADRQRRHPALDGVRAVAVLVVIAYHLTRLSSGLGALAMDGGFLGVDVFFVLSGYLITSLLQGEIAATGRLDLKAFYARRSLRLVPALLVAVPLATVAALTAKSRPNGILAGAGYALTYTTNFANMANASNGFLGHTWTLGLEEQYYLIWPVLLLVLLRTRRRLAYLAVVVIGCSLATPLGYEHFNHLNNFAPWTHGPALLLGSMLALLLRSRPGSLHLLARYGWLGGVGLAFTFAHPPDDVTLNSGDWLMVAAMVTALLAHLELVPQAPLSRLLSSAPLVWLGRRSYGLYLYSYPITLALLSRQWPLGVTAALTVALSLAVTVLSFRYVETPALRSKQRFARGGRLETLAPSRRPDLRRPQAVGSAAAAGSALERTTPG